MKRPLDRESLLEISLSVVGGLLLTGMIVMLVSRTIGKVRHTSRRKEPPPEPGTVPLSRHQNIGTVSTR